MRVVLIVEMMVLLIGTVAVAMSDAATAARQVVIVVVQPGARGRRRLTRQDVLQHHARARTGWAMVLASLRVTAHIAQAH